MFGGRVSSARPDLASEIDATQHDEEHPDSQARDSHPLRGGSLKEKTGAANTNGAAMKNQTVH